MFPQIRMFLMFRLSHLSLLYQMIQQILMFRSLLKCLKFQLFQMPRFVPMYLMYRSVPKNH
jgi:hypothetical protein